MQQENFKDYRIEKLRFSNTRGAIIPLHHAFLTAPFGKFTRYGIISIPLLFMTAIWFAMPLIVQFWNEIISFWTNAIYKTSVNYSSMQILGQVLEIPTPALEAALPSDILVYGSLLICCFGFFLCFFMPSQWSPLSYLLRAALIIQASASIDRILSPDYFPYTLQAYIADAIALSLYLIFLLPALLGMVYYIFPISWWRKITMSIVMIAYFIIIVPFQYMLHSVLIYEWTLLFLPLFYLLFGVLLEVLMFICLYSIGISWRGDDKKAMSGRDI